ncbi:hypothetical protein ACO2Q3_22345 [Caulobacter sp. KR2-114]|uniref:hypothetical protein n=1 Tax=Caulobacter sp. KR2-114 TaxID=3400912 RepID=UPI003C1287ED
MDPTGHAPGRTWVEILSRPTLKAFAMAFTAAPRLDAWILGAPVCGPGPIRDVFQATRGMYERIAFTAETGSPQRNCLAWQGQFQGLPLSGVTTFRFDDQGLIERIGLKHDLSGPVFSFSVELKRRIRPALPAPAAGAEIQLTTFAGRPSCA